MTFCAIIPDRNDRPELTEFCKFQLSKMTKKAEKVYHINHRPETERFDLIQRIHVGVNLAKADGFDWVFIIENDDAMPANYFDRFTPYLDKYDFLGEENTIYYNIRTLRYTELNHPYRSSLFTTAFRISALNNFNFKTLDPHSPFLDIALWRYARHKRRKFIETGAVGIKHGQGLCGGKGHTMKLATPDPDMEFLSQRLEDYHIDFYKEYRKKLTPVTA